MWVHISATLTQRFILSTSVAAGRRWKSTCFDRTRSHQANGRSLRTQTYYENWTTFFTYLRGTSRVGCGLDEQGMCFDCRWEKKILLSSEESTAALGPDRSPIWCVLQATETRLTTHLPLAQILRMHGAIPPLPHTLSWRCAQSRTRITLLHIP